MGVDRGIESPAFQHRFPAPRTASCHMHQGKYQTQPNLRRPRPRPKPTTTLYIPSYASVSTPSGSGGAEERAEGSRPTLKVAGWGERIGTLTMTFFVSPIEVTFLCYMCLLFNSTLNVLHPCRLPYTRLPTTIM
jgi:hypothetical protein